MDHFPYDDPEEDCKVLDYYPHRTPDTRKKNQKNTASLHASDEADNSSLSNLPVDLCSGQNNNVITEKTSSNDNISGNNITTTSVLNASEENLFIPKVDFKVNESIAMTCDNEVEPKDVLTCSNATKDVNCNNIDIKLANTDMICNNEDIESESKMDYKPVKCDNTLLSDTNKNTGQCDISPLSLEDSPLDVLDAKITTQDENHIIEMNVSSNNEELDSSSYDSDISDCSNHSCTTISSSDDSKIPTLVRVYREIMDKIGNKECWLLLPKLPQLTIDYWEKQEHQSKSEHVEDDGVKTIDNIDDKNEMLGYL